MSTNDSYLNNALKTPSDVQRKSCENKRIAYGVVSGVLIILVIVIIIVICMRCKPVIVENNKKINVNIGEVDINGANSSGLAGLSSELTGRRVQFNLPAKHQAVKEDVKPVVKEVAKPSQLEGFDHENSDFARIDVPVTGGIMQGEKAAGKKWDPKKMIPDITKSVRPKDSLAAKFGPSHTERQLFLPTAQDLLRNNPQGPKNIRISKPVRTGGDMRPLMIPKGYNGKCNQLFD
jgi:hypothetical protein